LLKHGKKTSFWKYYYSNGTLKKEGYYKDNLEHKYWYFYRLNTVIEKEGHFKQGLQNNWWLFYDKAGNVSYKCQLKKNGYCLLYKMDKLVKAYKYKNDKKIKEWTDFFSFKSENSLNDLRK
jgi:antitoxin component YwqK of YwqJK toxin-antitoxin module